MNIVTSHNSKVPKSIWAIGLAALLLNISSVIVFGLSTVYMKNILIINAAWIGFLEGVVEGCSYAAKLLSGIFSDYLKKRKIVMMLGFSLAVIARPILACFSCFTGIFAARILDRIGNGTQSTPRDALVGDLAPSHIKGKCYGLRQSLATAGSFLGGILGVLAMNFTNNNYQHVFWIATFPALAALIILIIFVKEPNKKLNTHAHSSTREKISFSDIPKLGKAYWMLMFVAGIFMCSRVTEAMLILHANQNFGLSEAYIPLVLILYNGTNSLISYPIGHLSDRIPRFYLLALGFIVLIMADLFLAFAPNIYIALLGIAIWGIQIGITQSMFMALIADCAPARLRGTGFGFFYLMSTVALIIANTLGGCIAHKYTEFTMFLVSSFIGALALIALFSIKSKLPQKQS